MMKKKKIDGEPSTIAEKKKKQLQVGSNDEEKKNLQSWGKTMWNADPYRSPPPLYAAAADKKCTGGGGRVDDKPDWLLLYQVTPASKAFWGGGAVYQSKGTDCVVVYHMKCNAEERPEVKCDNVCVLIVHLLVHSGEKEERKQQERLYKLQTSK